MAVEQCDFCFSAATGEYRDNNGCLWLSCDKHATELKLTLETAITGDEGDDETTIHNQYLTLPYSWPV